MAKHKIITLRDRLRDDTRKKHDALDAALGAFDLTSRGGLAAFLSVQVRGFAQMLATPGLSGKLERQIDKNMRRARADLAVLDCDAQMPRQVPLRFDPVALRYIFLGSRMGTAVLRRQWDRAEDPVVKAASAYFSDKGAGPDWRAFCEMASKMPAKGDRADRIVEDACGVFDLFLQKTLEITPHGELQNA